MMAPVKKEKKEKDSSWNQGKDAGASEKKNRPRRKKRRAVSKAGDCPGCAETSANAKRA
jgi:hypothetical protein